MNTVLDGRLDVIAYLPVTEIQQRICGRPDYDIEDLKLITAYKKQDDKITDQELEDQKEKFWRTLENFNKDERAQYLMFVWGRSRLPKNLLGVE